jgi:hypothetical protein
LGLAVSEQAKAALPVVLPNFGARPMVLGIERFLAGLGLLQRNNLLPDLTVSLFPQSLCRCVPCKTMHRSIEVQICPSNAQLKRVTTFAEVAANQEIEVVLSGWVGEGSGIYLVHFLCLIYAVEEPRRQ